MAVAQQIDNHFITPDVMQRAVKLHPAAVMLALLAGGTLGGLLRAAARRARHRRRSRSSSATSGAPTCSSPVEEVLAQDTGPPIGGHGPLEPLHDYVDDEIGVEDQVDRQAVDVEGGRRGARPRRSAERGR